MANKFEFQVIALDRFTKVFRNLNNSASKALRPVAQTQRQIGALSRELHLDKVAKGFRGVSTAAQKIASSVGLASGPMEALFGLGAAGGIVATVGALGALGARWGNLGFEVKRTSQDIGVSTDDLQRYRGAGKLAGLSNEALTNSFASLGRTLQDAEFGRNPEAFAALNKFGIGIKRNKAGVVDTVETFKDLSNVISQITSPQVQEKVADIFGLREALPLLRQGPDAIAKLVAQAEKFGMVANGDALNGAEKFGDSMNRLKAAIEGVANSWGQKLTPLLTRAADQVTKVLSERGVGGMLWDVISGKGTRDFVFGGAAPGQQRASGVVTGGAAPAGGNPGDPLGLRQNNPGNLRSWGGAERSNGFARFNSAQDGLNAMAQQIGLYANRDGLKSISSIVSKYAPTSENNTGAYIDSVSKQTGFDPNAQLDVNNPKVLAPLLSAMVKHEQGKQPFSNEQLQQAAQTVKVEVAFANAPAGTQAKANAGGSWAPTRVSYAMPSGATP